MTSTGYAVNHSRFLCSYLNNIVRKKKKKLSIEKYPINNLIVGMKNANTYYMSMKLDMYYSFTYDSMHM